PPPPTRLLDRVRAAVRARHDSVRTEEAYVAWIKRFILFHGKRHPAERGEPEINRFLTDLAVHRKVSASTQNQALSALLFLYQHVLNQPIDWVNPAVRAQRPERLPVVLTKQEVKAILGLMDGSPQWIAALLYGAGPASDGMFAAPRQGCRFYGQPDNSAGWQRSKRPAHDASCYGERTLDCALEPCPPATPARPS